MEKYEMVLVTIFPYKAYIERIKQKKDEIDIAWYDLTGVKGVRYDKESSMSHNVPFQEELKLDALEKIGKMEDSLKELIKKKREIDSILEQLTPLTREAILSIYCCYPKKRTYQKVAKQHHMSVHSLQYRIKKELEKVSL